MGWLRVGGDYSIELGRVGGGREGGGREGGSEERVGETAGIKCGDRKTRLILSPITMQSLLL